MDFFVTYNGTIEREYVRAQQRQPSPPTTLYVPRSEPARTRKDVKGLILGLLASGGWYGVTEIATAINVHRSSIHNTLNLLLRDRAICREREVRWRSRTPQRYRLNGQ